MTVFGTWRVGRSSSQLLELAADNQASRQGCFLVRLALFACPLYSCGKKNERSGRQRLGQTASSFQPAKSESGWPLCKDENRRNSLPLTHAFPISSDCYLLDSAFCPSVITFVSKLRSFNHAGLWVLSVSLCFSYVVGLKKCTRSKNCRDMAGQFLINDNFAHQACRNMSKKFAFCCDIRGQYFT